jgi:hypothetical protein
MRSLGKFFFPHLRPDQRHQRMNLVLIVGLAILVAAGIVGVVIIFLYKR